MIQTSRLVAKTTSNPSPRVRKCFLQEITMCLKGYIIQARKILKRKSSKTDPARQEQSMPRKVVRKKRRYLKEKAFKTLFH